MDNIKEVRFQLKEEEKIINHGAYRAILLGTLSIPTVEIDILHFIAIIHGIGDAKVLGGIECLSGLNGLRIGYFNPPAPDHEDKKFSFKWDSSSYLMHELYTKNTNSSEGLFLRSSLNANSYAMINDTPVVKERGLVMSTLDLKLLYKQYDIIQKKLKEDSYNTKGFFKELKG